MVARIALRWLVVLLLGVSACGQEEGTRERMVDLHALSVEDPEKQLVNLTDAIGRSKRDGSLYARRAMVLLHKGELDQALADANEAILLTRNNPAHYFVKAQVLYLMGRNEEALPLALRAERNSYESASLYLLLTELYLDQRDYPKAGRFALQALELAPDDAQAVYFQGRVQEMNGDTSAAMTQYRHAIALQPDFALPHRELASLYLARQEPKLASTHANKVIRLMPKDAMAWYYKGVLQLQTQRRDSALLSFEHALSLAGDTLQDAHYQIALLQHGLGEYGLALQHLEAAPKYSRTLKYLSVRASSLERVGENLAALRTYERMLAIEPKHTYAVQSVARLRYKLQRPRPQLDSMAVRQRAF